MRPEPLQVGQGSSITWPRPWQIGQVRSSVKKPPWVWRMRPWPLQCWQVFGLVPGLAPEPEQASQVTEVGSRTCAFLPPKASSSVISMLKRRSAPRSRPELRWRAPPMPKMPSKMSEKAEPKSAPKPCAPPPMPCSKAAWPKRS